MPAHRAAWVAANGPIPDSSQFVCHKCDNPPCVNVKHLFIGTHAENTLDRIRKGRSAKGEASGRAKLTKAKVSAIRRALARGATSHKLARQYGTSAQTIDGIADGSYWGWFTCGDGLQNEIEVARDRRGEAHPKSKLTEQNVRDIRALGKTSMPRKQIAEQFNISLGGLESILYGYSWKWLK